MEIFRLLDYSPVVHTYEVLDFKIWNTGSYIKMEIVLKNNTFFYIREYNDDKERNYSFHWQDTKGVLIVRWDNAPHHKTLDTFFHHKHVTDKIEESTEITLEEVLISKRG